MAARHGDSGDVNDGDDVVAERHGDVNDGDDVVAVRHGDGSDMVTLLTVMM